MPIWRPWRSTVANVTASEEEAVPGRYAAPAASAVAELREKGSRFLGYLYPVDSKAAVAERLADIAQRHSDSSHHCWAWRLGAGPEARERSNDAGEPRGTAGPPILQVLRGAELHDVLVVVVRWFGGTKLGKGGLARAYAGSARLLLADLPRRWVVPVKQLTMLIPYDKVGRVKRLVNPPAVVIADAVYGEAVSMTLEVYQHRVEELREHLLEIGVGAEGPDDSQ